MPCGLCFANRRFNERFGGRLLAIVQNRLFLSPVVLYAALTFLWVWILSSVISGLPIRRNRIRDDATYCEQRLW